MKSILYVFIFLCAKISAQPTLVVGTTSGYAPYVSLNDQGEYEGFDIDIAKQIAKKLAVELKIKDFGSMPSLFLALKQKKIDLVIWAVSITNKRMETMEMVYYQGEKTTQMPFIFWKNIPPNLQTLKDFVPSNQNTICIEAGTYQEDVLIKFPNISLKFCDTITNVILEIQSGKSLGAAIDPSLIPQLTQKYPAIKVLYLPLPVEEQSLGNGICLSKTNQELTSKIKTAVQDLIDEGIVLELEKKWKLTTEKTP